MRSTANIIKAQGVASCYEEQVKLVKKNLSNKYKFYINSFKKSDIVHYHTVNLSYFFERIFFKNKSIGVAYVHFLPDTLEQSLELPKFAKKIFYKYLLSFYNSMDCLITVNPCVISKLKNYGVTHPQIVYIPNFVSEKNFFPLDKKNIIALKKKYKIKLNKFVVLGVGQLQTRKGIFDFVNTAKKIPNMNFIWAGGFSFGKISDGYAQIKNLVDNAPSNVKFLGIIDRSKMNEIYNISNALFLPSFDELFPMAILEAYCCRIPVLLRDLEIYHKILSHNYLSANNTEGFVSKLKMLTNNKIYKNWQNKSYRCHKHYAEQNIVKYWDKLYETIYKSKSLKIKKVDLNTQT
jgi:1,2-diacylglycerol-3-alpha-glucose alpha-1,2-galactosyltransferase